MILVNINRSGAKAVTAEQIVEAAAGWWIVSENSLEEFGDALLAVRKNRVVGAWSISGYERNDDGDKVYFELLEDANLAHLIGEDSPIKWVPGAANPVKLVDSSTMSAPTTEIDHTPQGNARVRLDGWTLVAYPDGRARISPPGKARVVIESAFPGPDGANVTLRAEA